MHLVRDNIFALNRFFSALTLLGNNKLKNFAGSKPQNIFKIQETTTEKDFLFEKINQNNNALLNSLQLQEEKAENSHSSPVSKNSLAENKINNSFFYNSPNPLFCCNLSSNFIEVNTSFINMIGFELEELQKMFFVALIQKEKAVTAEEYFAKAKRGSPERFNTIFLIKSGKKIIVKLNLIPVTENGNIVSISGYVQDITKSLSTKRALIKRETKLSALLKKLNKILDSSLDIICVLAEDGTLMEVSAASKIVLGYYPHELIGKNYVDFVVEEDIERSKNATLKIFQGNDTTNFDNRFYRKDGSIVHLTWSSRWEKTDRRFYSIARDSSEQKQNEAAIKSSEEKYRIIFYDHPLPMFIYELKTFKIIEASGSAIALYGYTREDFLTLNVKDLFSPTELERLSRYYKEKETSPEEPYKGLWLHQKKNKETFYADITSNKIDFEGRIAKIVLLTDRTAQLLNEQELIKSNERYHFLSHATSDATCDWDLKTGKVVWNEVAKKMFKIEDVSQAEKIEWWFNNIHRDDREKIETKIISQIKNNVTNWEDEYRFNVGSSYVYVFDRRYILYDAEKKPVRMIGAIQDLTERKSNENILKQLNSSLEKRAKELSESNADLERFAYVASHDLQEPLRMVTSFLQLLEKRYKDKLDQKAHEYIDFAVNGAERMKKLILDLLEYSRINSSQIEKEDVEISGIIEDVRFTFKKLLQETGAVIHCYCHPTVKGNKTQIVQLFQNIIGNALKYKGDKPPVITINCRDEHKFFSFDIADNGIGIDPRFYSKIFIIFQRLHNREQYSGTGIGLAICKKIVEKHGGRIWVDSTPGEGSTFSFSLPKPS